MKAIDRVRMVLISLDYTPLTLAKATDITLYRAKRIFEDGGKIKIKEILQICHLTGLSPNDFIKAGDDV